MTLMDADFAAFTAAAPQGREAANNFGRIGPR